MKKHILFFAVSLFSAIHGMDDQALVRKHAGRTFDMWEFFSTNNVLDKLAEPIPFWNKEMYHDQCSPDTVAHLHILNHSALATKLATKQAIILNTNCGKGHVANFLSQQARRVHATDDNHETLILAKLKYKNTSPDNLMFGIGVDDITPDEYGQSFKSFYDLIVSCSSTTPKKLAQYHACLKPQGEFFCICTTRSNTVPLAMKVFIKLCPKIEKATTCWAFMEMQKIVQNKDTQYPTDEEVQKAIADAQFEVISYETKAFDITILNRTEFKKLYKTFILENEHMRPENISSKKRGKLANQFVNQLTKHLKKDNDGNWFYPFETTAIHLRKK